MLRCANQKQTKRGKVLVAPSLFYCPDFCCYPHFTTYRQLCQPFRFRLFCTNRYAKMPIDSLHFILIFHSIYDIIREYPNERTKDVRKKLISCIVTYAGIGFFHALTFVEQYYLVLDVNLFDVQNRYWVNLPIVYILHAI